MDVPAPYRKGDRSESTQEKETVGPRVQEDNPNLSNVPSMRTAMVPELWFEEAENCHISASKHEGSLEAG